MVDQYELFYGRDSPFSQHHKCRFEVDGMEFSCAEQYMMFSKAVVFEDEIIKEKIMKATDPVEIKHLGREVKNFEVIPWMEHAVDKVKTANLAKFSQNKFLKKRLFTTYPRLLVECSPSDTRWGIGLSKQDPGALHKDCWRGRNLLGQTLTNVRDELMMKENLIKEPTIPTLQRDQREFETTETALVFERRRFKDKQREPNSNKYVFYWGMESPFHSEYPCEFIVDDQTFYSVEHYMFYRKAALFKDRVQMEKALSIKSARELYNIEDKVDNYDENTWYEESQVSCKKGVEAKFSQNESLKNTLLKSYPKKILQVNGYERQDIIKQGPNLLTTSENKDWFWRDLILVDVRDKLWAKKNVSRRTNDTRKPKYSTPIKEISNSRESRDRSEKFLFFDNDSPLSNRHCSKFVVDGVEFCFLGQYMFYCKADFFKDDASKKRAIGISTPDDLLNSQVSNFISKQWHKQRNDIYKKGVKAKISQNEEFKQLLINSFPKTILNLQKGDRQQIIRHPHQLKEPFFKWRHWSEFILMEVRDEIMKDDHFSNRSNQSTGNNEENCHKTTARPSKLNGSQDHTETPKEIEDVGAGFESNRFQLLTDKHEKFDTSKENSDSSVLVSGSEIDFEITKGNEAETEWSDDMVRALSKDRIHGVPDSTNSENGDRKRRVDRKSPEDLQTWKDTKKQKSKTPKGNKQNGSYRNDRTHETTIGKDKEGCKTSPTKPLKYVLNNRKDILETRVEKSPHKPKEDNTSDEAAAVEPESKPLEEAFKYKDYRKLSQKLSKEYELIRAGSPLSKGYKWEFEVDGVTFCSVTQFVEYKKAELFEDNVRKAKAKIMKLSEENDILKCGREVADFDNIKCFGENADKYMTQAYQAKLTQHPEIKRKLYDTYPKTILEQTSKPSSSGEYVLKTLLTDIRNELMRQEGLID
ncbi:uncharacterized protein LOC126817334 isoform X2 [Patella vulgata]|uniref:uncharacterized protein LOC126817334 isoform X2 n=1 Tax=Patella vulgata TaxID=6465 RepID=UPI0024A88C90|nr:uncharacterized protein LOC126817334 isoform X2 [Patella vulgata]